MRIAAGILMIIGAIIEWMTFMAIMGMIMGIMGYLEVASPYELLLYVLFIFGAIFVIVGGICTLKRRAWKVCFTSSILLLPMPLLTLTLVGLAKPSPAEIIAVSFYWVIPTSLVGILPLIFVCLRKREWEG